MESHRVEFHRVEFHRGSQAYHPARNNSNKRTSIMFKIILAIALCLPGLLQAQEKRKSADQVWNDLYSKREVNRGKLFKQPEPLLHRAPAPLQTP